MCIEVISSGLCTTIQDGGRHFYQDKGIPVSGFMDVASAHLANLLVKNKPHTALVEMMYVGIKFKTDKAIYIAITGANMQPKVNGETVEMNKLIKVPKNGIVSLSGAQSGVYGYIAFSGEILVDNVYESKSTYLPAKIGGYKGRKLEKGDVVPFLENTIELYNAKVKRRVFKNRVVLGCLKGPEWNQFSKQSKLKFLKSKYTVTKNSNRIGIRLEGNPVVLPIKDEIISSGIVKGTVQITKGGFPIVMMADAPTTGGYLRMLNLTEQACNELAQVQIGGEVRFRLIE